MVCSKKTINTYFKLEIHVCDRNLCEQVEDTKWILCNRKLGIKCTKKIYDGFISKSYKSKIKTLIIFQMLYNILQKTTKIILVLLFYVLKKNIEKAKNNEKINFPLEYIARQDH